MCRTAVAVYRRERRFADVVSLDAVAEVLVVTDSVTIAQLWVAEQVRSALGKLRPQDREVIRLAYFEGCTQQEVSLILSIPIGTVKNRMLRAQHQLVGLLRHVVADQT